MNEKIKLVFTGVFLIIFFTIIFFISRGNIPKNAKTFEECIQQGNSVMESYPRQCRDKEGNLFVEFIGTSTSLSTGNELEKINLIRLSSPRPNEVIKSPLTITGEARGYWFFEASFPVILTDWDGKIIAQHYAEAQSEWMTEELVPFKATLQFENPSWDADFSKRGTLILQKDNPSGLPEHDDLTASNAQAGALEIPVFFE
ncbi:MAG: Gmad2 immunoglobulin-like domain-containing protein [Candidatus Spechtbacteria bacterium]|nr:Gmad2 immunoglobulin-like domain-containing protein [Candidatus Spechtbacteria bacterium]